MQVATIECELKTLKLRNPRLKKGQFYIILVRDPYQKFWNNLHADNMKIRHKFASLAYILSLFVFVQITNGFPFPRQLYSMNSDWNISSVPRSIVPHVTFKQHVHHLPPRKSTDQIEDELLANLESLKVC